MKISFLRGEAVFDENGTYAIPAGAKGTTQVQRFSEVDGKLVDNRAGMDDAAIIAAELTEAAASALAFEKTTSITMIKFNAGEEIAKTDWKVSKAREQDEMNGTSTLAAVLQAREDIRVLSNKKEADINAMTDVLVIRKVRLNT
jgi:hypothetical protein